MDEQVSLFKSKEKRNIICFWLVQAILIAAYTTCCVFDIQNCTKKAERIANIVCYSLFTIAFTVGYLSLRRTTKFSANDAYLSHSKNFFISAVIAILVLIARISIISA